MSCKILAVDTATENCSVALTISNDVIARCEFAPREHTIKVLPMVDAVLAEAGMRLNQLDALAFGRGPGSFTGVRIGVGIAQGLAFGADLPMIGVSTLAALAQGQYRATSAENVLSAIDARMGEVYWGQYSRLASGDWSVASQEHVITPDAIDSILVPDNHIWTSCGTGWETYADTLNALSLKIETGGVLYPEAQDMAHLAAFAFARGEIVNAEEASPVYLRDTVTWKKLPGRE